MSTNLLPNASFELELGEYLATNWADMQNALTLNLSATGQIAEHGPAWSSYPDTGEGHQTGPQIQMVPDAVDGQLAIRIATGPDHAGPTGHLTSPLVTLEPVHVYTLSVYARSQEPSATVELRLWTRPLDFRAEPDYASAPLALGDKWQRYQFTFSPNELERTAVVDLAANAARQAQVWFDAVQLERGAQATSFQTRYPVEASLAHGQPAARSRLLHLHGQPLHLRLTTYNSLGRPFTEPLHLNVHHLLAGQQVLEHRIDGPIPVGRHEQQLRVDFPLVGEFRASLASDDGEPIGVDEYLFHVRPVIEDDFQGVIFARGGKTGSVPAQRVVLPWRNGKTWYADPPTNLTVTRSGIIHLMTSDDTTMLRTADGGLTWDSFTVSRPVHSVLADGTFFSSRGDKAGVTLCRSQDQGQHFEVWARIRGAVDAGGSITERPDGTLFWPTGGQMVSAYRSEDGGRTWSDGQPICPGGEPQIVALASGKLLALVRHNPRVRASAWYRCLENELPWRLWMRALQRRDIGSYVKRLLMAESDDGGRSWHNVRPCTYLLDEMHGQAVQLPDGRLVLFYTHRVPALHGGERAKVSRDEGRTWDPEIYYMNATRSYPGYSASCVLPAHLADGKPGMILTVVGERSERNWGHEGAQPTADGIQFMPRFSAIRWRPLD